MWVFQSEVTMDALLLFMGPIGPPNFYSVPEDGGQSVATLRA